MFSSSALLHNYSLRLGAIFHSMDYTADVCKEGFTLGQFKRMRAMWHAFRAGNTADSKSLDYPCVKKALDENQCKVVDDLVGVGVKCCGGVCKFCELSM